MISSGTRGCELVCWWWWMTHSSLPSERQFWGHVYLGAPLPPSSVLLLTPQAPGPTLLLLLLPSMQCGPRAEALCPQQRRMRFRQAEVFPCRGSAKESGVVDIAVPLLVSVPSSGGPVGVRRWRVTSLSSV